jgi:hypothetical protein
MPGPLDVLARYVESFNEGARSGDFAAMVATFSDDAELVFEGLPIGPFHGRDEIAQAYREQPPDDLIAVRDAVVDGNDVTVVYGWQRDGYSRAGEMRLAIDGEQVRRLVITFDAPAPS